MSTETAVDRALAGVEMEPLRREGAASLIADRLRVAITSGQLAPGSQLRESQLAARLGVSRGPVREALQRLIQEGLVRSEPNRGAFVNSLSESDVEDLYRARNAIERAAASTLAQRATSASVGTVQHALERLTRAADAGRWPEIAKTDLAFHEELVAASGSERLRRMFATLARETRLCQLALGAAYDRPRELVREHERILAAIRSGDEGRIAQAVADHMEDAVERLGRKRPATSQPKRADGVSRDGAAPRGRRGGRASRQ